MTLTLKPFVNNKNTVIERANKRGAIMIQDRSSYINEVKRQSEDISN